MATVPSNNVAQVSGMTPEGASLAANVADQAGQNSRMAAQLQLERQRMAQDRELQEFHAQLSKEMQAEQLKAQKENLNLELSEKRRSEIEAANLRREEMAATLSLQQSEAELADLREQRERAAMEGRFDAERKLVEMIREKDQAIEQKRFLLGRIGKAVTGFDSYVGALNSGVLGETGALGQWVVGENERFTKIVEGRTTSSAQDLVRAYGEMLARGDAAASDRAAADFATGQWDQNLGGQPQLNAEGIKGRIRTEIGSVIAAVAGLEGQAHLDAMNDLAQVVAFIEKPVLNDQEKVLMDQSLRRLEQRGVDRDLISLGISEVGGRLQAAATAAMAQAGAGVQKDAEGNPVNTGGNINPMKEATAVPGGLWDLYRSTYIDGAYRRNFSGLTDTVNDNWLKKKVAPVETAVAELVKDLSDNGKLDRAQSHQYLEQIRRLGSRGVQLLRKIEAEVAQGSKVVEEYGEFATPGGVGQDPVFDRSALGKRQVQLNEELQTQQRERDFLEKHGTTELQQGARQTDSGAYEKYQQDRARIRGQQRNQIQSIGKPKSAEDQFLGPSNVFVPPSGINQ